MAYHVVLELPLLMADDALRFWLWLNDSNPSLCSNPSHFLPPHTPLQIQFKQVVIKLNKSLLNTLDPPNPPL